jgi:hypothetical protein
MLPDCAALTDAVLVGNGAAAATVIEPAATAPAIASVAALFRKLFHMIKPLFVEDVTSLMGRAAWG